MNSHLPVAINVAVALAAKAIGLLERNKFAGSQFQHIAVFCIVAIQAPSFLIRTMM